MDPELFSPTWWGGAALWMGGTTFQLLSIRRLITANPHREIPQFWGRPENFPRMVYAYRAVGIVMLLLMVRIWSETGGMWPVLLMVAAFVPLFIANTHHNLRVRRRRTPSLV